jgi:hypothetical protein
LNWIWFRLESIQQRNITSINAGYSNSFINVAAPVTDLAQFYFHGRLVIFDSDVDLNTMNIVQLQNMFSQNLTDGRITLPGTILYDSRFANQLVTNFDEPITIEPGNVANVVLSPGLRLTDTDVFSYGLHNVWLSVQGNYGPRDAKPFPYVLR